MPAAGTHGLTDPTGQKEPIGHVPEQLAVWRLEVEPKDPAGQNVGAAAPATQ